MPNNGLRDFLPYGYPGSELLGAEYDTPAEAGRRSAAQQLADDLQRESVVAFMSPTTSPKITGKEPLAEVKSFLSGNAMIIGVAIVGIVVVAAFVLRR